MTSHEADFAAEWGRKSRGLLEETGGMFGIQVDSSSRAADRWDILGHEGGMRTAGVGGPITGKGADLLIVDDPIKNSAQAASETYRNNAWDWWQSTAYTRLEPDAAAIIIQTRWHEDDLSGRILRESKEPWRILNLPALAEAGTDGADALGRLEGEPLWPERWSKAALENIRDNMLPHWWQALYQQRPSAREGGMFKRDWFEIVDRAPSDLTSLVRAWDLGGTENDGDYTAGVLLGTKGEDIWIPDVVRGQWESGRRDDNMGLTAMEDDRQWGGRVKIWFPQDPAQAGKHQARIIASQLAGYPVRHETCKGDKVTRADPFASRCWAIARAGRKVKLVRGPWNRAFIDELTGFPNGVNDDQVDAVSFAFVKAARTNPFEVHIV